MLLRSFFLFLMSVSYILGFSFPYVGAYDLYSVKFAIPLRPLPLPRSLSFWFRVLNAPTLIRSFIAFDFFRPAVHSQSAQYMFGYFVSISSSFNTATRHFGTPHAFFAPLCLDQRVETSITFRACGTSPQSTYQSVSTTAPPPTTMAQRG